MKEKLITKNKISDYEEKDNRYFKVNYITVDHVIRSTKSFKRKDHLNKFLDDSSVEDLKIYVCDMDE